MIPNSVWIKSVESALCGISIANRNFSDSTISHTMARITSSSPTLRTNGQRTISPEDVRSRSIAPSGDAPKIFRAVNFLSPIAPFQEIEPTGKRRRPSNFPLSP